MLTQIMWTDGNVKGQGQNIIIESVKLIEKIYSRQTILALLPHLLH
jgi:hypothetical protein